MLSSALLKHKHFALQIPPVSKFTLRIRDVKVRAMDRIGVKGRCVRMPTAIGASPGCPVETCIS